MVCRQCHHATSDLSHDYCRTHAYCARDGQYLAAMCNTCDELWDRAKDLDCPDDAVAAFQMLKEWVEGFRRNARARPRGVDHFFDPQERIAYDDLYAVHANLRLINRLDSSQQLRSQQVRIPIHVMLGFSY